MRLKTAITDDIKTFFQQKESWASYRGDNLPARKFFNRDSTTGVADFIGVCVGANVHHKTSHLALARYNSTEEGELNMSTGFPYIEKITIIEQ